MLLVLLAWGAAAERATAAEESKAASPEAADLFEQAIRPLLIERCHECHGAKTQWGSLRLDSRAGLLKGGDSGAAIVPGRPDESELLRRVSETDDSLRMPPAEKGEALTKPQQAALRLWIKLGAPWPNSPAPTVEGQTTAQKTHWAFQSVRRPPLPAVRDERWVATPIDRFILHTLEAQGLTPSPPADRRALIRRATYDLTGLPPTPAEVAAFVSDESPDAYRQLIDRLLESPHYGEQWGRHWLDVARYSDTKGYVYAREERFFVHASGYRDWVVRAFNQDLPYDRFLLLQLAADQAEPHNPADLAAMGFLTLGRRFLGVTPDIIDDRIDVVTRGTMGLTVACARCHDHKYDPIPTADYYALYGVFQNCSEQMRLLPLPDGAPEPSAEFVKELQQRKQKLAETLAARREETAGRIRARMADYLFAQRELEKYPEQGFDQILAKSDLIPATVRRWQAYLATAAGRRDPVFIPWLAFAELSDAEFRERAVDVTRQLAAQAEGEVNPVVAAAFAEPPTSPRDVAERYAAVFATIEQEWREAREAAGREKQPAPQALGNADHEALRQVLYGPNSPCVIPDEPIVNLEAFFDSGTVTELWKLQGEVDRWLLSSPQSAPHAVVLVDRPYPVEPRIFRRGNPANKGPEVPRQFLLAVAGEDRKLFTQGSGRLEMAQAIVDPANPLTARVWVNRVWLHHFGEGLVSTPSDFGLRAAPPSHPELLDWLADELVSNGWSTKALHRTIMLSAAYQQRSDGPADAAVRRRALQLDPANRLLWRANPRRLSFEEMRDTLLAVSGELDRRMGGKPDQFFTGGASSRRRSIYKLIDRQFIPGVLRVFDFANPDLHSPQRSETSVPQQALFALNHPFLAGRAQALVKQIETDAGAAAGDRVQRLYQAVLQRLPTPSERAAALAFLADAQHGPTPEEPSATAKAWSYGYGELDEMVGRLKSFTPLPHFNGSAWQGGPQWPDAALGWVQLTAQGGHAGNDLQHAAVRRWTAPQSGTVSISSQMIHEVAAGDGVRCWIVSSRHGVLQSATVHNTRQPLNVEHVDVQAGGTLDFIVDYHANLNSDQFLWSPQIALTSAAAEPPAGPTSWNAEKDFVGPPAALLGPWEQLAQVLLISNEVMFVD